MSDDTAFIEYVEQGLRGIFIEQCIQVVICSILVYDFLTTMDMEARYFWNKQWYYLTHILYFANRYMGIFGALSTLGIQSLNATTLLCKLCQWVESIGDICTIIIVDYVLAVRVLALWENNKTLSIILKSVIICEAVGKATLVIKMVTIQDATALNITGNITVCTTSDNHLSLLANLGLVDWLLPTTIGSILMFLALYRAVLHWTTFGLRGFRLINVIIRDQVIYYILVLLCSVINIISFKVTITDTSSISYIFNILGSPSWLCLLGSRLFFNLKEAAKLGVNEGTNYRFSKYTSSTISDPHFADPHFTHSDSEAIAMSEITMGTASKTNLTKPFSPSS